MRSEFKVGALVLGAIGLLVGFSWLVSGYNPFDTSKTLRVMYNFAGGIEPGSPVRVMGIKVGRVKTINFRPGFRMNDQEEVQLEVVISVSDGAWPSVKSDSKVFINLAGVIGEKFIEIIPGSSEAEPLSDGQIVRGEDPPRIDQLISQSYGLAGTILDFLEENKGDVVGTIQLLNQLVKNLNTLLKDIERLSAKKENRALFENLTQLTADLAKLSQKATSADGQKSLELINTLLWRLKDLDKEAIKKFLQEEGIRAKIL